MVSVPCFLSEYGLYVAGGLIVIGGCHAYLTQLTSKGRAAVMLALWTATTGAVYKSLPVMTEACLAQTAPAAEAPVAR